MQEPARPRTHREPKSRHKIGFEESQISQLEGFGITERFDRIGEANTAGWREALRMLSQTLLKPRLGYQGWLVLQNVANCKMWLGVPGPGPPSA